MLITRCYPDVLSAWRGLVETLAYTAKKQSLRWGTLLAYPCPIVVEIDDLAADTGLHLNMPGFTKGRWTRFLRQYCRPDLCSWIDESLDKLRKYPERAFVCSYDLNPNGDHNYGNCLSSLQIRLQPQPAVILYSRATQIDKAGFLDLMLMHLVAKRMAPQPISGMWIVSLAFINALGQLFYLKRFDRPLQGHGLEKEIGQHGRESWHDAKFGPHQRALKRIQQLEESGDIPGSVAVSELALEFTSVTEEPVELVL